MRDHAEWVAAQAAVKQERALWFTWLFLAAALALPFVVTQWLRRWLDVGLCYVVTLYAIVGVGVWVYRRTVDPSRRIGAPLVRPGAYRGLLSDDPRWPIVALGPVAAPVTRATTSTQAGTSTAAEAGASTQLAPAAEPLTRATTCVSRPAPTAETYSRIGRGLKPIGRSFFLALRKARAEDVQDLVTTAYGHMQRAVEGRPGAAMCELLRVVAIAEKSGEVSEAICVLARRAILATQD